MSGLLCVYHASGIPQDTARYLSALRRLSHRGPDGEGVYSRQQIFLGHRLRFPGSEPGVPQPVEALEGRVALAYDGRISNRRQLSHDLEARGHRSEHLSDASLILDAYLEYGDDCFRRLEGSWALVLWDEREGRVLLSRDRLGLRPLYYFQGKHLVVASEIKSILALDEDARALNPQRIRDFLPRGLIDDWSDTFFLRVRPVPPGSVLRVTGDQITISRFWTLAPSTNWGLRPAAMLQLLGETIARDTSQDVDVALSLSGGIDSSVIAGLLARDAPGPLVRAFSVTPPHTPDESAMIDATVRRTGLPHRHVPLAGIDYSRAMDRMLDAHDEPVQSSGNLDQFLLRQAMAEAGCKSVLVGYGADEIFAGYEFLARPFVLSLIRSGRIPDALRFAWGARPFLGAHPLRTLLRAARDFRERGLRGSRQDGGHVLSPPWMSPSLAPSSRPHASIADLIAPWLAEDRGGPVPGSFDLRGVRSGHVFMEALLECFRAHIPLLIRIEDRNASAHGLELRAPFLDHRVVEMALAFPFHEYMRGGFNKAILRRAAAPLLAPEVLAQRRKYYTPGNDAFLAFDVLRPEFLQMMDSGSFSESGLWAPRSVELYLRDAEQRERGGVWLRVYMVQRWYDRVVQGVRGQASSESLWLEEPADADHRKSGSEVRGERGRRRS